MVVAVAKKSASSSSASKTKDALSLTDDQEKRAKAMVRQILKEFDAAELTDEQKHQGSELFGQPVRKLIIQRDSAQITADMQKQMEHEIQQAKQKNPKSRSISKATFESHGFNADQITVFRATENELNKARRDFLQSLSHE